MDVSELTRLPPASIDEAPTMPLAPAREAGHGGGGETPATETYQQCDECGAPVDNNQRYCVSCGAHRRHVNDPAARYMSQATARSRSTRASANADPTRRSGGRARGLGTALVLALIPLGAAIGVTVGRSSNNGDAKLIQALEQHQAAASNGSGAPAATSATATSSASTPRATSTRHTKTRKASRKRTPASNGKAVSTTPFGSVSQIAGSKPTAAQVQQGAQDTQKVQKSTGKNYVNQQNSLPGTVVVP
jgi:hypothetical protein